MLAGDTIGLRPVRNGDLDQLYEFHQDLENRGRYFPLGFKSEPDFKDQFRESGFWGDTEGMLLIVTDDDDIIGHIEFFQTLAYLDELELSYHVYSDDHRGAGVASEAVRLMTAYLFATRKKNRIRLIIHPENTASKRVAEKCRYELEGVMRGAWFNRGQNHDVEVYVLLRADHEQ